jgi:hypothetical protein
VIATPEISESVRRAALSHAQEEEMFVLLSRYFDGVSPEQFIDDLDEKTWVIQLRREGRLVGFSTLLVRDSTFVGAPITAVYSGDTIVAPEAWGSPALARAWIATVNRIRAEQPERRCFWLLLTSGFRTYRFLPVFWREFYPRFESAIPPAHLELMQRLATEQYGHHYDPSAGLVRFPHPQRLRGALSEIPAGRSADPDVAFFLSRNPGHALGDELVCLTEICETNLTRAGQRMVADSFA